MGRGKKHKRRKKQTGNAFQPLPQRQTPERKAENVQARYEAGKLAYLKSPQYMAEKAQRDTAFAEAEEWRRIRAMMKGAEEATELDEQTRELFGL